MSRLQFTQSCTCPKNRIALPRRKATGLFVALATLCFVSVQGAFGELAFQQLYEFSPIYPNPKFPVCKLAEGIDGNFYGTTSDGGSNNLGTVFKITHTGELTALHSFDGTDGGRPFGGLVQAADGNFYGTTTGNGFDDNGKIFRINATGALTPVAAFWYTNGAAPRGQLVQGSDGCLYGTTLEGGTFELGTVFKVTTNGALTSLFSFNGTNGSNPFSGLVQGNNGNFYGTTEYGGSNFTREYTGSGTVFKITTNGVLTTLVYFNGTNGFRPSAGLVLGSDGNFYGTTSSGGTNAFGTVFQMTTTGTLTTLFHFNGTNGNTPMSGLAQGRDGNFYGTTAYRIASSMYTNGTIFKLTTNGVLTTLVYLNGTNGLHPFTDPILGRDGNLYGTMCDAEKHLSLNGNAGTLYRLAESPSILSLTRSNGDVQLTWTSFTNGIYQVESKPALAVANWTPLVPQVTATGSITSFTNTAPSALQEFYRVRLLP